MARSLNFIANQDQFACELEKVERNKLYGWVEKKAFDKNGGECYFGSISSDGMHMFGRSAFEQGYRDTQGDWVESAATQMVDAEGEALEKHASSFNADIALDETVSLNTYLMHVAKSVYHLNASEALIKFVEASEEIYTFPFCYYASHTPDNAFLIASEGELFMVIGQHCGFEFLEMQAIDSGLLEDDEEDDDEIDFSMF